MKTITLRSIPIPVARALRRRAEKEGISVSKAVIRTLEDSFGVKRKAVATRSHDLDRFAGTWTKKEAAVFDKALRDQRRIDKDLWK